MEDSLEIKIGKTTYKYQRPKLKKWVQLDEIHSEIREAATRKDTQQLNTLMCDFLVVAFSNSDPEVWNSLEWETAFILVTDILSLNRIRIFLPLIVNDTKAEKPNEKKDPWEYRGRSWAYWTHTFAKEYGWTAEEIEQLSIEDALQLLQEILVDRQFEREWQWSLTEIAYPYNANSKKNVFKPLNRPAWMRPIPEAPKKVKILKMLLPLGNVINMSDLIPKRDVE